MGERIDAHHNERHAPGSLKLREGLRLRAGKTASWGFDFDSPHNAFDERGVTYISPSEFKNSINVVRPREVGVTLSKSF